MAICIALIVVGAAIVVWRSRAEDSGDIPPDKDAATQNNAERLAALLSAALGQVESSDFLLASLRLNAAKGSPGANCPAPAALGVESLPGASSAAIAEFENNNTRSYQKS
jgi:hypothetical protein